MILGRRPYELHLFARTRESCRAKTIIPSGHAQPASYNQTVLAFRLFHACLVNVTPLRVRKKRNPTNYGQFFSIAWRSGQLPGHLAGWARMRTFWDLSFTVGIPFSRWGAKAFVVHPLPFPTRILEDLAPATEGRSQAQEPRAHPFLLAQSWRQQMEDDTKLNRARIAARDGISRARVTQVMNLLRLPAEIQAGLLRPHAPLEIHSFSERSLRVLVSFGDEETQTSRWRELVQELKDSAGN